VLRCMKVVCAAPAATRLARVTVDSPPFETIWRQGKPPADGGHPGLGHRILHEAGMEIERDAAIVLRDGVTIYADVFRPVGGADLPTVLTWGPYGKHFPTFEIYGRFPGAGVKPEWVDPTYTIFEGPDPTHWCAQGYAIVNVDPRGLWCSEGDATFVDARQEAVDCYDAIEWAAAQGWSNGRVGMTGVSYLTQIQWQVAALRPPHLAALNCWEGVSDHYREFFFHGGIPDTRFPAHWTIGTSFSLGRVEDMTAMMRAHPLFDAYWETKAAPLERIVTPAYVVASWSDHSLHTRGTFEGFKRIASEQKWLEVHGRKKWEHYHRPESVAKQIAFFDHFLRGAENEVTSWPRVAFEVRERAYVGTFRTDTRWPPASTEYLPLHLEPSAGTLVREPPAQEGSVRYDATGGRASFDFAVEADLEVVGNMKLRLWVGAEGADDMDLFVAIQRFDASGEFVPFPFYAAMDDGNVALGWLRVSHRELDPQRSTPWQPWHTHRREERLAPGEVVPVEIEIWPSGTHFHAGETLRLVVQGSDVNKYPRPLIASLHESTRNRGAHVLWAGGGYDSHLLVPLLPPA
jgi:predicted acyl esterase